MSEEQIASALITAINTQLASYGVVANSVKALDYDDAVGVTAEHVQFSLARRTTGVERAGREAQAPYRATTRPVAKTIGNGREMARRVELALSKTRVTVAGKTSTPIRLDSADDIGPDDGMYSGLTTWTFVL